jgi:hypothetical protein
MCVIVQVMLKRRNATRIYGVDMIHGVDMVAHVINLPMLGGGYFSHTIGESLHYTIDIERAKLEANAYYARKGECYDVNGYNDFTGNGCNVIC